MHSLTSLGIHGVRDVSIHYMECGPENRTKVAIVTFHTESGSVEVTAYVQGRDNLGVLNAALVEQEIRKREVERKVERLRTAVEAPL